MDGIIDHSRLICSLCMTPYSIPEIRLEKFFTGIYNVDLVLYNSTGFYLIVNYLSILYGMYSSQTIHERLLAAQVCIYLVYGYLCYTYLRIENLEMYTDIMIRRRAYVYWIIQLYSSYMAYTQKYGLMSLTAMISHNLIWREHLNVLRAVNQQLIMGGPDE